MAHEFDPAAHAQDATSLHLPEIFGKYGGVIELPRFSLFGYDFCVTKYMVVLAAVAVTMTVIFIPLAIAIRTGKKPKGRFWNLFEVLLVFIRDQVIRVGIGSKKDAEPFVPYLWTLFFFILFCNMFGLLPWSGSPTGSMAVTIALALCTFIIVVITGMKKHGYGGFWLGLVPHMDLPFGLGYVLKPLLFVLEIISLIIKHGVLSIRLWANMFAGHLVLAVFMSFIAAAADSAIQVWLLATSCSIAMCTFMMFLELLVAFLQAYIFTFLSALNIGAAIHQH